MKNYFRILVVATALSVGTFAADAQTWLGVKGGYAMSWIRGTVLNSTDEKAIPHSNGYGGVYAQYCFDGPWVVQAEILYAGKGHTDKNILTGAIYRRALSYIQVPLFVGISGMDDKFNVMLGPELGYLLKSTTHENGEKWNSTDECRRFNIALGLQFNYMFSDNLGADVKFDFGLNKTFVGDYKGIIENKGNNMSVQLGICYRFEL